jgi:hypothetical protein
MIISVHQPQYIPWLGYFDKIARSDAFVYLDKVQYKPREFQNRNRIRTRDGSMWLTVPVVCKGKSRQSISEAAIDNEFGWQKQHLNSLKSWYGHARYFDSHLAFFEGIYSRDWGKLADLNIHIIDYLLKALGISTPIYYESGLGTEKMATDRIIELCRKLKADVYLSGSGGKNYLEEEKFPAAGIRLEYQHFTHPVYTQQFMSSEKDFIPYMSIIDLLFNEGPRSKEILGKGGL